MLADSNTGYVLKFKVYEGKTGNKSEKGLDEKVVLNMTEDIYDRYHHVFFDNFFTGINLLLK